MYKGSGMVLTAGVVAELFVKFMETEGHEGIVLIILSWLTDWYWLIDWYNEWLIDCYND